MKNLTNVELMKQLDSMNACHDADRWLVDNRHTLKSALEELPLANWAIWLHKQIRRPDARQLGIPQSWIDKMEEVDAGLSAEKNTLKASYIDNNREKNWDDYNAALTEANNRWHRILREHLISTIVD